jgi:hypothetical protein
MTDWADELSECNARLFSLLGSTELVTRWWNTTNQAFGMKTPEEVFQDQPGYVLSYLRRF